MHGPEILRPPAQTLQLTQYPVARHAVFAALAHAILFRDVVELEVNRQSSFPILRAKSKSITKRQAENHDPRNHPKPHKQEIGVYSFPVVPCDCVDRYSSASQ